ncbi:MAG: hypothetical protein GWO24_21695 [Akkermansiaceae bacterium]|nr:hypothetical protein [Akkermansiaceae bacterium]
MGGTWTCKLRPVEVIQLLYRAGLEQHRLESLRATGVRRVEVRTRAKSPPARCREAAGRTYPISEAPPLPHDHPGCQCTYAPVREGEAGG